MRFALREASSGLQPALQSKQVAQHQPFIQLALQLPYCFCLAHVVPSDVFPPLGSWHAGGGPGGDGGGGGGGDEHWVGIGPCTTVPLMRRLLQKHGRGGCGLVGLCVGAVAGRGRAHP